MQNISTQPPNEPAPQQAQGIVAAQFRAHSGPLPDAQSFLEYKNIRADLPDLIISEWIKESETRRILQNKQISIQEKELSQKHVLECWKLVVVSVFCIGMIGIAGWLAYKGAYPAAASLMSLPAIIGVIDAIRNSKAK